MEFEYFTVNDDTTSQSEESNPLPFLVVNSVLLGLIVLVMFILLTLLIMRRKYQPLKKKSPNLIILSCLGNFAFCLCLLVLETTYQSCQIDTTSSVCLSKGFTQFNCLLGFALLSMCEPLSIMPYVLRSIRLYVIFRAQEYYFQNKKKPQKWFTWIKEGRLIKICLIWTLITVIITVGLFFGYLQENRVFIYIPSYTVWICYMKDLTQSYYYDPHVIDSVNQHTNISVACLLIVNFTECMIFVICMYKLKNIKDDFNIRSELSIVFLIWFITSFLTIGFFIYN